MISAILLDVGSTLVDPHPSAEELVLAVLAEQGYPVETAALAGAVPGALRSVGHLMPFERYGQQESAAFWDAFYTALMSELALPERGDVRAALYDAFQRLENWRLYPDVVPTLQQLRAQGYRLAVVSNWEEWLEDLLLSLEVHHLFDAIVASGPFGRAKPHPSIFQRALELLGASPGAAVHVGDNPRDDIQGALAAGLRPILIDRRGRHQTADVPLIRSLDQLVPLLD